MLFSHCFAGGLAYDMSRMPRCGCSECGGWHERESENGPSTARCCLGGGWSADLLRSGQKCKDAPGFSLSLFSLVVEGTLLCLFFLVTMRQYQLMPTTAEVLVQRSAFVCERLVCSFSAEKSWRFAGMCQSTINNGTTRMWAFRVLTALA